MRPHGGRGLQELDETAKKAAAYHSLIVAAGHSRTPKKVLTVVVRPKSGCRRAPRDPAWRSSPALQRDSGHHALRNNPPVVVIAFRVTVRSPGSRTAHTPCGPSRRYHAL